MAPAVCGVEGMVGCGKPDRLGKPDVDRDA